MAELHYLILTSLDGYVADEEGNFDWAAPDEEVHTFVNDIERPAGLYLLGRRMYEVMLWWETLPLDDQPAYIREFADMWRAADKVIYSRTLEAASSARTHIEREFDAEAVRRLKVKSPTDIGIGGPELAGQAIKAGLVDEVHLFIAPISVGRGTPALPTDARVVFELLDERRFGNGMMYVRYRVRP
jgi:dihydrofolate reductase